MNCFPLRREEEEEKLEHDLPRCYFGKYWCQNFLRYKEPDDADRTAGDATVEDLAPGVIQQVNPKNRNGAALQKHTFCLPWMQTCFGAGQYLLYETDMAMPNRTMDSMCLHSRSTHRALFV